MTNAERVRLSTLEPQWWGDTRDRYGQGISFECPHCKKTRIAVAFDNPLDGGPQSVVGRTFHHRSGDDFETLTIRPSVTGTHWHGFISDGLVHP